MQIIEAMIEKRVIKLLADMEVLCNEMESDFEVPPIEKAKIALRNKPIFAKLMQKRMLLTLLRGV